MFSLLNLHQQHYFPGEECCKVFILYLIQALVPMRRFPFCSLIGLQGTIYIVLLPAEYFSIPFHVYSQSFLILCHVYQMISLTLPLNMLQSAQF